MRRRNEKIIKKKITLNNQNKFRKVKMKQRFYYKKNGKKVLLRKNERKF